MRGPCAKQVVVAVLTTREGVVFTGDNSCINPQPVCPRSTGEGYAKCVDVCNQDGHAEAKAIRAAGAAAEGSTIALEGHIGPCLGCQKVCAEAGVREVTVDGESVWGGV